MRRCAWTLVAAFLSADTLYNRLDKIRRVGLSMNSSSRRPNRISVPLRTPTAMASPRPTIYNSMRPPHSAIFSYTVKVINKRFPPYSSSCPCRVNGNLKHTVLVPQQRLVKLHYAATGQTDSEAGVIKGREDGHCASCTSIGAQHHSDHSSRHYEDTKARVRRFANGGSGGNTRAET